MREIKFRCWDKDFNEYSSYHLNRTTVNDIKECERFVFEQFTGLKDKNGVEIYEGDIMKTQTGKVVEVCFNNGIYHQKHNDTGYVISLITNSDRSEVIGNIHEHKHLIS